MYFKIPEEYIFMEKQGWLETQDIVYANDVENKYLWLNDMEWFSLDRIKKYINLAGDEEKFIPFAHTVSYDKWAWYIENNKNISVYYYIMMKMLFNIMHLTLQQDYFAKF